MAEAMQMRKSGRRNWASEAVAPATAFGFNGRSSLNIGF
jgi:hypothetical protein